MSYYRNPNFTPVTYGDILRTEYEEPLAYWEPYFVSGKVIIIFSEGGVGKTYYALHAAEHIACGVEFLGRQTRKAKVLYCDCEMGHAQLQERRCQKILQSHPKQLSNNLSIYSFSELESFRLPEISNQQYHEEYLHMCAPFDVVIFDNYLGLVEEASSSGLAQVWLRAWRLIAALKTQGKLVVLVHHTNRSGGFYGSMAMHKDCDAMLQLRRSMLEVPIDANYVEVIQEKCRFGQGSHPSHTMYSSKEVGGCVELRPEDLDIYRYQHFKKCQPRIDSSRYPTTEFEKVADSMGMRPWELRRLVKLKENSYGLDLDIDIESGWDGYDD